jgi:hypothetical protein
LGLDPPPHVRQCRRWGHARIGICLQAKPEFWPVFTTLRMTLPLAAMLAAFSPLAAKASVNVGPAPGAWIPGTFQQIDGIAPETFAAPSALDRLVHMTRIEMPALPFPAATQLPPPSIVTPLKKLFCVEYARARSGLAVFGDAKYWWSRARNLYTRMARPAEEAVMVFSGTKRLKHGHVAVVTHIVSSREIRVDQANWQNKGEIDLATPVLDVSAKNDWSRVRVWNMRSNGFGAHVYAVSGFIAKSPVKQARAD